MKKNIRLKAWAFFGLVSIGMLPFLLIACGTGSTTSTPSGEVLETFNGTEQEPFNTEVFRSGTEGYHTFRIPAIVRTAAGTLLAFAEGRINGGGDYGDIDLVLRRSTDNGATWGPLKVVASGDGETKGNPVPVVDQQTGTIFLFTTHNFNDGRPPHESRRPHVQSSMDDGLTWSEELEVTAAVKLPHWQGYFTGPGHGIQLERGPHEGRLVIPANHTWGQDRPGLDFVRGGHVVYSDDGGQTWQLGATDSEEFKEGEENVNPAELSAFERVDGHVYFIARDQLGPAEGNRAVTTSADGGETFESPFTAEPNLVTPIIQASTLRLRATDDGDDYNRVLFSAPAHPAAREVMAIRSSYDEGETWETWEEGKVIHWGPAGYSDMVVAADGEIGLLYEKGESTPYETITFTKFAEAFLDTPNVRSPSPPPEVLPSDPRTTDSSREDNDVAIKGQPEQVPGRFGQAFLLDGMQDHFVVPFSNSVDLGDKAFTWSAWFKYGESTGSHTLMWAYRVGANTPAVWLRAEPTSNRIRALMSTGNGAASVATTSSYNDGEWHHMALRKDDETFSLWIDGEQVASVASVSGSVTAGSEFGIQGIHIGQRPDGVNRFKGTMDDVRIYKRALSRSQILLLSRRDALLPRDQVLRLEFEDVLPCPSCTE